MNNLRITDIASFNYLNSNPEIKSQVLNFLLEYAFNIDSKVAANEMVNRIRQNPTLFKTIKPFSIEKKIDDTLLDPCSKNVLTSAKNTTENDIAKVLAKLDANNSVYNTIIKTEILPSGNSSPATTKWNSPYNYTIYISPDYNGKTKLFIASLIFHEIIHAYFMSLFDDFHNANPSNAGSYNDFPFLFDLYVLKKYPASTSPVDIHHLQMANTYVDALSRALQEYQTGVPVAAGTSPDQIYTDLAWGGLNQTPIFESTYPVGNPNRQRILNRTACEQNGTSIGQGTPNEQNPIGQPCN